MASSFSKRGQLIFCPLIIDLQPRAQRDLNRSTRDFAIAHGRVAVTHVEQRTGDVHGKINCVAHAGLGGVGLASVNASVPIRLPD